MAQRTTVVLVDDLNGRHATDSNPVSTVRFGLDGVGYEIDLDADHELALRDVIEPYALKARRVARAGQGRPASRPRTPLEATRSSTSGDARERNRVIRNWAREQGHALDDRGRLPAHIRTAYEEAHR